MQAYLYIFFGVWASAILSATDKAEPRLGDLMPKSAPANAISKKIPKEPIGPRKDYMLNNRWQNTTVNCTMTSECPQGTICYQGRCGGNAAAP